MEFQPIKIIQFNNFYLQLPYHFDLESKIYILNHYKYKLRLIENILFFQVFEKKIPQFLFVGFNILNTW